MGIALTDEEKAALRRDASIFEANSSQHLDQLLIDLQDQIDAIPVDGTVDADALAAGAVTAVKLADAVADLLVAVDWGAPGAEAANKIEVQLQLDDAQGNALAESHVLEVHVSDTATGGDSATATISDGAGAAGTIISGDGTAAIRATTDASGHLDLEVSEAAAASRYLIVRPCYGSPLLDCRETVELAFT